MSNIKNIQSILSSDDFSIEFPTLKFRYIESVKDLLSRNLIQIDFVFQQRGEDLYNLCSNIVSFLQIFGYNIILESGTYNGYNRLYLRLFSYSEIMVYSDSMTRLRTRPRKVECNLSQPSSGSEQDDASSESSIKEDASKPVSAKVSTSENTSMVYSEEKCKMLENKGVKTIPFVQSSKLTSKAECDEVIIRHTARSDADLIRSSKSIQFPDEIVVKPQTESADQLKQIRKISELEVKLDIASKNLNTQLNLVDEQKDKISDLQNRVGIRINTLVDVSSQWVTNEMKFIRSDFKKFHTRVFRMKEISRYRLAVARLPYTIAEIAAGFRLRLLEVGACSGLIDDVISIFDRMVYTGNKLDDFDSMARIFRVFCAIQGDRVY